MKDRRNEKFGRLLFIKPIGYHVRDNGERSIQWFCQCDCGNSTIIVQGNLAKSCGCLRKEKLKKLRQKDLAGQKFGLLTVIKPLPTKRISWDCICACGNHTNVVTADLISNHTKSCGCLRASSARERKGESHPSYRHDITEQERIAKRRYRHPLSEEWRNKVFQRDDYKCEISGLKGRLQAHHLLSWASNPSNRFEISNGVTLHIKIHRLFHKIYGIKNNTPEQYQEFRRSLSGKIEKEADIDILIDKNNICD